MMNRALLRSDVLVTRGVCFLILFALTVVRLIGLHLSVVDPFFDEAQYWLWSRDPLAWIIAFTVEACGNGEACVRAASPIFYLGTSLLAYAIANLLYGERTAFWGALVVATSTSISFSSRIVSTDVPRLKLLLGGSTGWAVMLDAALGAGVLLRYQLYPDR
jgi:hypothetical protein